jgi:hypothetical protein
MKLATLNEMFVVSSRDSTKPFALPGDSGSLMFANDGSPAGLVVAVNQALGKTYGCKASNIERLLGISFVPPVGYELPRFDPTTFPRDPKDKFAVLISGISIGHRSATAGTLGTFVWDKETGEILCLTCAHIAAPPGAMPGDPIFQPGPLDIRNKLGREPADEDIAGYLVRWELISFTRPNRIDAALFRPMRPVWPNYHLGYGERALNKPVL